jgi:hypothetical protein
MKYSFVLFPMMAMLLAACTPEFRPENTEYEPRMVIYGTLQPDSVATVFLSFTRPLPGLEVPEPDMAAAQVRLFENGVLADSLTHIGGYWFSAAGGFRPTAGKVYHIEAVHPLLPRLVTDKDTLPPAPVMGDYTTHREERGELPNVAIISTVNISIPLHTPRYYIGHRIEPDRPYGGVPESQECSFRSFYMSNIVFPDFECFPDKKQYLFTFGYGRLDPSSPIYDEQDFDITLCYTNEPTARFHKSVALYQNFNEGIYATDPFFEPVFLPGFVQGGYGFVGTMNCATVRVEF